MPYALKTAFLHNTVAVFGLFIFKNSAITNRWFGDSEMFFVYSTKRIFISFEIALVDVCSLIASFFAEVLTYVNTSIG